MKNQQDTDYATWIARGGDLWTEQDDSGHLHSSECYADRETLVCTRPVRKHLGV